MKANALFGLELNQNYIFMVDFFCAFIYKFIKTHKLDVCINKKNAPHVCNYNSIYYFFLLFFFAIC